MSAFSPPLQIDLNPEGPALVFNSTEELVIWRATEDDFFRPILDSGASGSEPISSAYRSNQKQFRARFNENIAAYESSGGGEGQRLAIKTYIEEAYKTKRLIASSSIHGQLIGHLLKTSVKSATYAYGFLVSHPDTLGIVGVIRAILVSEGISEHTATNIELSIQAAVNRLSKDAVNLLMEATQTLRAVQDQFVETSHTASDIKSNDEDYRKAREEQFAAFLKQWTDKADAINETLETQLSLRAPVNYWTQKRKHHSKLASRASIAVAAYFGLALLLVSHLSEKILGGGTALNTPLSRILVLATALAVLLWGGRLLVRYLLSNLHLEQDAYERVVLANTFLALMRKQHVDSSQKELLLAALFRHSNDGIVSDDAAPIAAELASKFTGKNY